MNLKRTPTQNLAALIHVTRAIANFSLLVRKKAKADGKGIRGKERGVQRGKTGEGGGCQL